MFARNTLNIGKTSTSLKTKSLISIN